MRLNLIDHTLPAPTNKNSPFIVLPISMRCHFCAFCRSHIFQLPRVSQPSLPDPIPPPPAPLLRTHTHTPAAYVLATTMQLTPHYFPQASCSVTMLMLSSGARAFRFVPPPATGPSPSSRGTAPLFTVASPATGRHQDRRCQRHDQHRRCFRRRRSTRASPEEGGSRVAVGAAARGRRSAGVGSLRCCSQAATASTPDQQVICRTRVGCAARRTAGRFFRLPRRRY